MNYKKQLVKFSIERMLNLSVILFLIPMIAGVLINLLAVKASFLFTGKIYFDLLILIVLLFVSLTAHEGFHAVGFLLFGKAKPKDIKFGIIKRQGMLYCSCSKPINASAYCATLILPIIVTGIIPFIISVIYGNFALVILFAAMISGGAGDLIMFSSVVKQEKKQLILDHPKAPAYYLVYEENDTPEGFVEATEAEEAEILEALKKKPFTDGKKSLGLKIFYIFLFLLGLLAVLAIVGLVLKFIA